MHKEYLECKGSMPFEEAVEIAEEMEKASRLDDDSKELYDRMLEACVDYLQIRSKWNFMDRKEKTDKDERRTMTHDVMISRMESYGRYVEKVSGECKWKDKIGDLNKDPSERKRIGDLGCYIGLLLSLNAR